MYQLIFVPESMLIIEFIPTVIFFIIYIVELKHFLMFSLSIEEKHFKTAVQTIPKFSSEEIVARTHKHCFIFSSIFIIIFTLLSPIIIIVNLIQAMKTLLILSSLFSLKLYEATCSLLSLGVAIYLLLSFFEIKDSNKIFATNLSIQLTFS
jgi:hypothetical protein